MGHSLWGHEESDMTGHTHNTGSPRDGISSLIRKRPEPLLSLHHNSKKMAIYRPAIMSSPELDYADILISDFQPPAL